MDKRNALANALLGRTPARNALSPYSLERGLVRDRDSLQPAQNSLRDRLAYALAGGAERIGAGRDMQRYIIDRTQQVADYVPGLGDALAADDFGRAVGNGDTLGSILAGGGLAVGGVPVVGDAAGKAIKKYIPLIKDGKNAVHIRRFDDAENYTQWRNSHSQIMADENGLYVIAHPDAMFYAYLEYPKYTDQFKKKYPHYWRFTNNKNEINLIKDGNLRRSKNHVDNTYEKGLSVADGAHYGIRGYKYGYGINGNVIGNGSDGEPVLDIPTLIIGTPMMSADRIVAQDRKAFKRAMQNAGIDPDEFAKTVVSRPTVEKMGPWADYRGGGKQK